MTNDTNKKPTTKLSVEDVRPVSGGVAVRTTLRAGYTIKLIKI
jgi:hypothetical protein